MNNYLIQGETLTGIADAIRAKSGSSDEIKVSDFATQIEEIEGGGGNVKIATGTIETGGGKVTVTHGLGVVPDIIVLYSTSTVASTLTFALSGTTTFFSSIGITAIYAIIYNDSSAEKMISTLRQDNYAIDGTRGIRAIGPADETTFSCGNASLYAIPDGMTWLAIGGLT